METVKQLSEDVTGKMKFKSILEVRQFSYEQPDEQPKMPVDNSTLVYTA